MPTSGAAAPTTSLAHPSARIYETFNGCPQTAPNGLIEPGEGMR